MQKLYFVIGAIFCVIVVISNMISAKLVILPYIGLIPAGLVTYPLTFLLSDLVTEIYGQEKAKLMVYTAFGMSLLTLCMTEMAILLPTDNRNVQSAFELIFGLNSVRVFSSLTAYTISQVIDIRLYTWIKSITKGRYLWVRNNGSTCTSQLIDTVVVDILFLYWGLSMSMATLIPIMILSYGYKVFFSFITTPLFYLAVSGMRWIEKKEEVSLENKKFSTQTH